MRGGLRRRWLSALVVAGIVAVVSGSPLTLAAGARRTASAPDAYTAAVGGDLGGLVTQDGGPPRTGEVAALPGVESLEAMTFLFASVVDPEHPSATGSVTFSGSRLFTSRLVAGRTADPADRQEFVADQRFVAEHHARLGERYQVVSWTSDQVERGEFFDDNPQGPTFEGVLVGIFDSPATLEDVYSSAIFSPALLDEDLVTGMTLMSVRLRPGSTTNELRSELDRLPESGGLSLESGRIISSAVRNAVDAQAQGIWLMAAALAIAAVVAVGQLLTRHARLSPVERRPLAALGFTRGQLAAETMARAAVPAAVGIAVGTVFAILASGLFPAGFVRGIEPNPGVRADVVGLAVGGVSLLLGVLAWVGVALLVARPNSAGRTPSPTIERIARSAPSPAAAAGTRFALTGHERSGTAALGTVVALALIVAGVVGASAFAASLDRLVSDPGRFGHNYTLGIGDIADLSAGELRTTFEGDPDIEGLMILSGGQARAGVTTVRLIGVEHVQGDLAPLGANDGVGQGGVMTAEGLLLLEPSPGITWAAMVLRPDAPSDASRRLAARVGLDQGVAGDAPSAILNVARVRRIPGLLAALLAALALLTMIHALIVSVQGRRDLAVLRAIGTDGGWIERAVHWQATVLTALPFVIGVPFGLIAGSFVFRAFVDRIGAVPDPALPIVLVLAMMIGLIGVANLVAVVPAKRARGMSTARLLRVE